MVWRLTNIRQDEQKAPGPCQYSIDYLENSCEKIYSNDDRMKILELIEKTKDFHHILIDQWAKVKNIAQALDLIEKKPSTITTPTSVEDSSRF